MHSKQFAQVMANILNKLDSHFQSQALIEHNTGLPELAREYELLVKYNQAFKQVLESELFKFQMNKLT